MPWLDDVVHSTDDRSPTRLGLLAAVAKGDTAVRQASRGPAASTMGTTLTLAYITGPMVYLAHVGDSRGYLIREGKATQLTTDHTLAERLAQTNNVVLADDSPWHHALWNVIGGGTNNTRLQPELKQVQLHPGDSLLLCTDGLSNYLSENEIADVVSRHNARHACAHLIDLANEFGGGDNITVVIAKYAVEAAPY